MPTNEGEIIDITYSTLSSSPPLWRPLLVLVLVVLLFITVTAAAAAPAASLTVKALVAPLCGGRWCYWWRGWLLWWVFPRTKPPVSYCFWGIGCTIFGLFRSILGWRAFGYLVVLLVCFTDIASGHSRGCFGSFWLPNSFRLRYRRGFECVAMSLLIEPHIVSHIYL